jgi:DNA primase
VQRGLTPAQFTLRNAPDRFARLGDLFAPVLSIRQRLEPAIERLQGLVAKAKN